MKTREAKELGTRVAAFIDAGNMSQAYTLLSPVLAERTPFRLLDLVGAAVGVGPLEEVSAFLDRIAADKTEGGWVVIASALYGQFERDFAGAFARCRKFIIAADVWYAPDILGERVPGPALVTHFQPALDLLAPWREDANAWVRRTVGIAVHFWAKRSRGQWPAEAEALLAFLEPMFEEREMDAIKGVGWGLKTLGRYYPDLVTSWLERQVVQQQRRPRALMLRKALKFLSDEQRANVMRET